MYNEADNKKTKKAKKIQTIFISTIQTKITL